MHALLETILTVRMAADLTVNLALTMLTMKLTRNHPYSDADSNILTVTLKVPFLTIRLTRNHPHSDTDSWERVQSYSQLGACAANRLISVCVGASITNDPLKIILTVGSVCRCRTRPSSYGKGHLTHTKTKGVPYS